MAKRAYGEEAAAAVVEEEESIGTGKKRCSRSSENIKIQQVSDQDTPLRRPEWRNKLRRLGVGYGELLSGWFPFVKEDFCSVDQLVSEGDEEDEAWQEFDDIWQIRRITEIPTQLQTI